MLNVDLIALSDVRTICAAASSPTSTAKAYYCVHEITSRMGFSYCALVRHVDTIGSTSEAIHLIDHPRSWVDMR